MRGQYRKNSIEKDSGGEDWMELDWTMATKEFLAIEFKRTQDARIICVERATAVAQEQYKSLLTGLNCLPAVGQVKGWKVQQIKFVVCMKIGVSSTNKSLFPNKISKNLKKSHIIPIIIFTSSNIKNLLPFP